jgi:hypothetical protein
MKETFAPLNYTRPDFPSDADLVVMMCRHIRHIEKYWTDDSSTLGHFGSLDMAEWAPPGGPINEEVIRSMAQELMGYAVLYKHKAFDAKLAGVSRKHLLDRLNRCLRWICAHHVTGELHTTPLEWHGQWGDDWESSLWAGQTAMAADWVWDALDADVREQVLKMMAFEGDRFIGVTPPDGRWLDTKAEENAWDSFVIAWAYCLQPNHPHAPQWLDAAKAFALNTFTTDLDRVDTSPIEGKAIRDWVSSQTAHPDLTVENHGSFHPGYLGCGGLLMQGRFAFQKIGLQPPPHFMHHVLEVWEILKRFHLCNAFVTYPSGQDWGYHWPGVDEQAAVMAREFGDEIGGHLLWEQARYTDLSMCYAGDGRFDGRIPHACGGRYFQFETGVMGGLAAVVMVGMPKAKRLSADEFRRKQAGCVSFPFVWLQIRRSRAGTFSFCWRSLAHGVMGAVFPAGAENTFGADQDGLVGRFDLEGKRAKPKVIAHTDHTSNQGFRTTGEIQYGDGQISQRIAVAALDDGETTLFIDLSTARPGAPVTRNEALGVYLMNDFMDNNHVSIAYAGGKKRVRGVGGKAQVIETGSPWMQIVGSFGLATSDEPLLYEDAAERNTPERWKSVLQDRVFIQPKAKGATLRDFAVALRLGRGGARLAQEAPERVKASGEWVRAYRVRDARGNAVTVIANLGYTEATSQVGELSKVIVPPLDLVIIQAA